MDRHIQLQSPGVFRDTAYLRTEHCNCIGDRSYKVSRIPKAGRENQRMEMQSGIPVLSYERLNSICAKLNFTMSYESEMYFGILEGKLKEAIRC